MLLTSPARLHITTSDGPVEIRLVGPKGEILREFRHQSQEGEDGVFHLEASVVNPMQVERIEVRRLASSNAPVRLKSFSMHSIVGSLDCDNKVLLP